MAPWDLEPDLPWRVFTNPIEKWGTQPSFVIGEYLFMVLAVLAAIHAWRSGRNHVFVWVAALVAGTANDLIFMALPLVDNFWQAQATIMLTPRLPLYIPCVYVCFMYIPTVAVRRVRLPRWSQAALTGLVGYLFYHPYDIVGAKFLWWTWHDTDAPIAARILGAPMSSSLWTLTFVGAFAWLVDRAIRRDPSMAWPSFIRGLGMVAAFTTLLMMLQMTVLQQLDGGTPGPVAFGAGVLVYAAIVGLGVGRAAPEPPRARDRLLHRATMAYLATLVAIMAVFDPATHRSTGVHQIPGECGVEVRDITGQVRHEFLCIDDFDEDYTFACTDPPAPGTRWYTICGRPHSNFTAWLTGVSLLAGLGMVVFSYLLGPLRAPRHRANAASPPE